MERGEASVTYNQLDRIISMLDKPQDLNDAREAKINELLFRIKGRVAEPAV